MTAIYDGLRFTSIFSEIETTIERGTLCGLASTSPRTAAISCLRSVVAVGDVSADRRLAGTNGVQPRGRRRWHS